MNMEKIVATLTWGVDGLIRFKLLGASILGAFVADFSGDLGDLRA